jgi:hypothetical protein
MNKIFISYSHKDEEWKDRLLTHLNVLAKQNRLEVWDDRRIAAGDEWLPEIEQAINSGHVALLLVSANFLTSNFILNEKETFGEGGGDDRENGLRQAHAGGGGIAEAIAIRQNVTQDFLFRLKQSDSNSKSLINRSRCKCHQEESILSLLETKWIPSE